jgi:hypothetical protein
MRNLLIAIGLLALTGLTGCDWWSKPAPPVAVTCHCAPPLRGSVAPPAAASARAERTRTYRRHAYHSHRYHRHGHRWHKRYAEGSMDIYNYSSHSRSYGESHYGGYAYGYGHGYGYSYRGRRHGHHHGDRRHERGFRGATQVWADGYGRRHLYDRSAVRHYVYQARVRRAQGPERLDPWHGYNDDWDW